MAEAWRVNANSFRRADGQLSKLDWTVIALQQNRAGFAFAAIKCSTGDAGNNLLLDDRCAVQVDRHASANHRNVDGLPFPGGLAGVAGWGQKSVNATDVMRICFLAKIVFDLNFISAPQIDPAVLLPLG